MNDTESSPNPVQVPKDTTHFSAYMIWPDHQEKLSFKETSRSPRETRWPLTDILSADGTLNLDEFIERWGEGTFVIQWLGTDQEGRFSSLGKTPPFVLGQPTHEEDEENGEDGEDDGTESEDRSETDVETSARPRLVTGVSLGDPLGSPLSSAGNGATAPAPSHVPLPMAPPPLPVPATDPLAASMALFQFHWQMAERARAEARADQELAIRRYEIDRREALERQRMLHEQELERNRLFYKELQKGSGSNEASPMAMMRELREMVSDEMQAIEERVAERGGGGSPSNAGGGTTAGAVIDALKEAMPIALPMIQSAMGGGNGTAGGQS